ncbi:MAG TPA: diguanylate cyclase [Solirubrobacteraceae bacterium]|jgi:diguanylate cyclase (GGDEF)-like protein/PAS domain S-box-containing protein|nr:diguanylate cyclase [Solirubrobacteraceae bacterium]
MQIVGDTTTSHELVDEERRRAAARRGAADAMLREHPDALIFAQSAEGHIVPVPPSLGLGDRRVLEDEGRTGVDLCVAEDRMAVVKAWVELKDQGIAEVSARLRSDPHTWRQVKMIDLRDTHGVILTIGWVSSAEEAAAEPPAEQPVSSTPRFCTRRQDGEGNVIECDDAYLQMFGYRHEAEVVGHPTFERVHPDDQARVIESWVAMVATKRPQMARVRMRCGDEGWLWVDTTYHNYLAENGGGYVLAECIDVSAEMAAQEALQDREALLRRLVEELPDGLLQLDARHQLAYTNTRLLELLALPAGDSAASTIESLLARCGADGAADLRAAVDAALSEGAARDVELETGAPEPRRLIFKVLPLLRDDGVVGGVIASVQDVTDSARAREELERQASSDPLTGAHNRTAIMAELRAEIESGSPAGVVYVDLDRFKQINDTLGHAAGDELLLEAVARLRGAMRSEDVLGRLGGDEFMVVLRRVADAQAATRAAERIGAALRGSYELSAGTVELTASIGVAFAGRPGADAERLVERADEAMYRSKRGRRGAAVLARD